jgi:adenine specific DNA methylase Mod
MNRLYYGDNLDVLRRHVDDESVDLVYLDPPFNSNANYNVLFAERDGTQAASQIKAFEDTWKWDEEAARSYEAVVEQGGRISQAMLAFRTFLDESDMMAYLAMMAPRLVELRRVLKPTGSLYLHCDPTASHYLKILLDAVFGPQKFRSEIIWKRSSAHSDAKQGRKLHGHIHDVILFYTKTDDWTWNDIYTPYESSYVERDYKLSDETGRRFRRGDLTAAKPGGDTEYDWRVKKPAGLKQRWTADLDDEYRTPKPDWEYKGVRPYKGRYWAYSRENMRQFAAAGRLRHTFEGMPEYKRYLDEMPGTFRLRLSGRTLHPSIRRHSRTAWLSDAEA